MSAIRDFLAYHFVMIWPGWRGGWFARVERVVLPYAGRWAYQGVQSKGPSNGAE